MTRSNYIVVVVLCCTISAFAQRTASPTRTDGAQVRAAETVAALQKNLKEARRVLLEVDDKRTREQLELFLARAALHAAYLEEYLEETLERRPDRPISAVNFAKLLKNLKQQSFDNDKVEFIKNFVKGRPISCKQAREILEVLSFDEGRVKAAITMHPSIVDPKNFYDVLEILPFDSSRRAVMEAVKKKRVNKD